MSEPTEFFDEQTLLEMVDNQLSDGHPLQVKATLMRLVMKGTPVKRRCNISPVPWGRADGDGSGSGPFNLERYGQFLDSLPEMPWAE